MKNRLFLVKTKEGKEAMMRLPVNKYDGITTKGHKMIIGRLGSFHYALNIEAYSDAGSLLQALEHYKKSTI